MAESPKANIQLQSILAILMVSLVVPLVAGGSIALAGDFSGEKVDNTSPDDVNGFAWLHGTQGNCVTTNLAGVPTTTTGFSSNVVAYGGTNYTTSGLIYTNGSYTSSSCYGTAASNDFRLGLPSNIFTANESHSNFFFRWITNGGCTASCNTESYDAGWSFDWSVYVNGTEVFGDSSTQLGYYEYGSNVKPSWVLNYSLNVVDYNKLSSQISECGSTCSYVLHFDNVVKGQYTGSDFSNPPWEHTGMYKVETLSLNSLEASLVMTVTPWVLTVFFLLVALASTPYWDPVWKNTTQKVSKMKKQGGLY